VTLANRDRIVEAVGEGAPGTAPAASFGSEPYETGTTIFRQITP
jgi:hypothetical protein